MAFQPADTLKNRTFIGLIVAQFLAGFNDQAIHASAMFYAIHQGILTEAKAISWMPVLFYAPWAIFCTISGYLADRYSKTYSLIGWKFSEIIIALIALTGFILGSGHHPHLGAWIVLSTVFLMGTHAAFFAPAKYGAMPEILQPHILSRGNGILESTTFLAAILGTVCGGLLSHIFHGSEYWIGAVLLGISLIGAVASLMIAHLPAGNPARLFPKNLFMPLIANLRIMFRSLPLALAALGIAFFVFMVAYMRACMYMHGETRVPPWDEFQTSLVVATVALGVGLGSPLAGYLSGGKIELGLVPLGCLGMITATLFAALWIHWTVGLIIGLVAIGFFSGFYMVPLYTMLQQRAPKTTKGDLIATSNFINVTGAMAASALFFALVYLGQLKVIGVTPLIPQEDKFIGRLSVDPERKKGRLKSVELEDAFSIRRFVRRNVSAVGLAVSPSGIGPMGAIAELSLRHGKIRKFEVSKTHHPADVPDFGKEDEFSEVAPLPVKAAITVGLMGSAHGQGPMLAMATLVEEAEIIVIDELFEEGFFELFASGIDPGQTVIVSTYKLRGATHYRIRPADQPLRPVYDDDRLPRYLFIGAALMTLGILLLLCWRLPDFLIRTLCWFRCLGRFRLRAVNLHNLPTHGPVILATNCGGMESTLQLLAATDRYVECVVPEHPRESFLFHLIEPGNLIELPPGSPKEKLSRAHDRIKRSLHRGNLVALSIEQPEETSENLLAELRQQPIPIVPVFCGPLDPTRIGQPRQPIRIVFGEAVAEGASLEDIRHSIRQLGEWIRLNDDKVQTAHH